MLGVWLDRAVEGSKVRGYRTGIERYNLFICQTVKFVLAFSANMLYQRVDWRIWSFVMDHDHSWD